jgi:hypothetical protein
MSVCLTAAGVSHELLAEGAVCRNPLLLLLSALPKGVQCAVIRAILR